MNEMKTLSLGGKTYDSFVDQTARDRISKLEQSPENAGLLLYIGDDGALIPLRIGDGLAIVDGVLVLTSAVATATICGNAVCSNTTICGG